MRTRAESLFLWGAWVAIAGSGAAGAGRISRQPDVDPRIPALERKLLELSESLIENQYDPFVSKRFQRVPKLYENIRVGSRPHPFGARHDGYVGDEYVCSRYLRENRRSDIRRTRHAQRVAVDDRLYRDAVIGGYFRRRIFKG